MLVHARINGSSHTIENLEILPGASDGDIKAQVAARLDVSVATIERHAIDRGPSGDLVIRPEAVYG